MTNPARIQFLVKDLLDELGNESPGLGTGAYLRVQELLRRLPKDTDDEALLLALAPLLAHSPQEQERVYETFRQCQTRADALFGTAPEQPPPPPPFQQEIRAAKIWVWVSAGLLAALLGAIAWIYLRPAETAAIEKSFALTAGQTTTICPDALPELDTFGLKIASINISSFTTRSSNTYSSDKGATDKGSNVFPTIDKSKAGITNLGEFFVQNDTCLLYAPRDSAQGMDSIALRVGFTNGNTCELRLRLFVSAAVPLPPPPPGPDTLPDFRTRQPVHDHTQALLDLVVRPTDPWLAWLAVNAYGLRSFLFFLFSILLYELWRWFEWRRRKLVAEIDRPDNPPYIWNIRIEGADDIVLDDAYRHALQVMRRRSATDTRQIDLPGSITATAEGGGMPRFRFRPRTRPVDYLLLLDRQSSQNHRTQLFDAVFRAFREQELNIERFYYDSDIRSCFNEEHPEGARLADIAQRYGSARLIVVGSGFQLFHAGSARLESWVEPLFKNWPNRLLLTPVHPDAWGRNERRLQEIFTLLPATLQSLGFWVEELEHGEDARFERWRDSVRDTPAAIYQPDDEQPIPMLLLQFPPETVRWIAACAIYPGLHWDLTLWLGREVAAQQPDWPAGQLDWHELLGLFRIRWFVQGQIPQNARAALLDWLEQDSPGMVARLRRDLAELLAGSPPPEKSAAWTEHRLTVLLNRWLSETDAKKKKEQEKEIEQLLPQTEADFTVLKYLDRPPTPLHFEVPDSWKKYVYRGGFRAFGFTAGLRSGLVAALVWLLAAWGVFSWEPAWPDDGCRGQKVAYTLDNKPLILCLDSPLDSLLWYERLALDTLETRNLAALDSIDRSMGRLLGMNAHGYPYQTNWNLLIRPELPGRPPVPQDTLLHVFGNISAELYNIAATLARSGQKDLACVFFQRALVWDDAGLLRQYQTEAGWCEGKPVAPTATPATDPACRVVVNVNYSVALRNQDLSRADIREIAQNPGGTLDRETLAGTLALGRRVELLDSTSLFWKVRDGNKTGFVAKTVNGKPLLAPCGQGPGGGMTTIAPAAAIPVPTMIKVPGGTFSMGEDDDAHEVTLSDFEIGQYEVSIGEYLAFCDETKTHYPEWLEPGNEYHIETGTNDYYKQIGMSRANKNHPVTGVSWNDAAAYCQWLSAKTGRKFRLPTEAEWEYAARGGPAWKDGFTYAGGNNPGDLGWYDENSGSTTHPVGQKKKNQLDLYDMSGNVWEWCADWYDNYENPGKPLLNPQGPATGSYRVDRGGSWSLSAQFCRVALRNDLTPGYRGNFLGFRLASSPQ